MKKFLPIVLCLVLAGCVAIPVDDSGYYYPDYGYYGPYSYSYPGPDVNIFYSGFYGGRGYRDRDVFRGGDRDEFRGGRRGEERR
ncbi:MAG: hypothetical protein M0T70_04960 [Geobacteraceae bacterium]|nr:hypothetical protein [Geobacteraceae bacterium]